MPRRRPKKQRILTHFHLTIVLFSAAAISLGLILFLVYFYFSLNLPSISKLAKYEPPAATTVLDHRGEVLAYWYKERRFPVPLSQVPPYLIQAFVSAEDARFYEHQGLDFWSILRALIVDIKERRIVQGGSTITQQVARALLLTRERTFKRKLKEAILAWQIDSALTKDEILTIYLNQIYLGAGAYGVEAAARTYFNKHVWELTLPEAALIAGLTPAPSRYNPFRNPELALKRRAYVLTRMAEEGYISLETAKKAMASPLKLNPGDFSPKKEALYFLSILKYRLEKKFGKELYTGGYTIYASLDLLWQEEAIKKLKEQLELIAKRNKHKDIPQGAIICLDNKRGAVRVLIGGRDYEHNQFNRAVQARRQPGSAFKPIIWATAIEKDIATAASKIVDEPIVLPGARPGSYWQPKNFDRDYFGIISLRTALVHSRNTAAVKLAYAVGLPDLFVMAKSLGIKSPLAKNYSVALGSSGLSLLELTRAYSVFANQGVFKEETLVDSIFDRHGQEIPLERSSKRVLSAETAYIMEFLLHEVVREGTGRCAKQLGVWAAGKTGTTDNYQDAWFIGFTPDITCGVWIGYDKVKPLGRLETGGRAACPLWVKVMKSRPDSYKEEAPEPPKGIVFVETKDFDPLRGEEIILTPFKEENVPELKNSLPRRSILPNIFREILRPLGF
ncbi:penicillin-binding protein, 1A family [Thermodesulfatator indicus DSM 15286]|uniref:Penicillin-binding protein, 1A family n=1 Tax=Thermodesulfatator indicus (strain DSM 15286 / JCM 11887 / CIR29812) TaxID=667014 RepID=F8ACE2_THEID|nr:penicillin-binding protein 1A [Thermodesulfatator indicus]AEH44643.1 penicillin-binding protein, 1A family [Thermodesulfatator indicus DSM 15286]